MNKGSGNEEQPTVYSVDSTANLIAIKSRETYFKRRRRKSGIILLLLSLLVTGLLTGIIALGILYARNDSSIRLCDTEDCVRIAASLKQSMDLSIDPCEDFYQYACGRWSTNHPIPDTNMMHSWFHERADKVKWRVRELLRRNLTDVPWAVSQAKALYDSCINIEALDSRGLEPLLALLTELNLPRIPAGLSGRTEDFTVQIARVRKLLGKDVFVGFDIIPDPRNRSLNVIVLDTPSVLSPLPGDKEIEKRIKTLRVDMAKMDTVILNKYGEDLEMIEKAYITNVIKEIISNGTLNTCNSADIVSSQQEEDIKNLVDQIYELTGLLYQMSHADNNETLVDEGISENDYMLIAELQKVTDDHVRREGESLEPKLTWKRYIEEIFKDINDSKFNDNTKVLIANLGYLKDLSVFIASIEEKFLETIAWWTVVDVVAPHSSNNLRNLWATYVDKLIDIEIYDPRSLHCAEVVNYMMGMAVSWMFADSEFHDKTAPKVIEMLEDIRSAFAYLVIRMNWIDIDTKLATLEKSKKMVYVIGYPEWLFDQEKLNKYYEGVNMKDDEYLRNMLMVIQLSSEAELSSFSEINYMNDTYWAAEPTDVNAVYTVMANHITLNYGAIGTVLGHELTHGFDNTGKLYDSDGNIRQWWTNETVNEYKDKAKCFIKHYESYYEKEINAYIDGTLTLDENIADNGGLREAVYAYRIWKDKHGQEPYLPGFTHLTHEQLLFLSFAHLWCEAHTAESLKWMLRDTHSPGHVRLRAVLTNSKEFSDAWKCPVGTPMNPEKKCQIW